MFETDRDELIDVICEVNPHAIPIVGGLDFACDFREAMSAPLRNKRVIYAAHPYPGNSPKPWEETWEDRFGLLEKGHPVMLTEFGFDPHDKILPQTYKGAPTMEQGL